VTEYTDEELRRAWQALRARGLVKDQSEAFDPVAVRRDEFVRALVRFECQYQRRLAEQRSRIPAVQRRRVTPWNGIDLKRRASGDKDDD